MPSSPLETCAHFSPLSVPQLHIVTDHHRPPRADPLPRRPLPHHRPAKDVLLFLAQEQATRDSLLPRWDTPRFPQMANDRRVGRDVRVSQSFRVRVVPCVKRTALCDLLFTFFFSSRDFFPVILTFLRQLPFIGQFLNLPFIRPVRPSTPLLFIRTISHSLALWPRVLPARGSFSRLPYLRSVIDTTMISYYLNLLDGTTTTVVVNARSYWILDTGSGWNEHRASLSRLNSGNSFDVIRSRQHQGFSSTHKHFLPFPSVSWPLPQEL